MPQRQGRRDFVKCSIASAAAAAAGMSLEEKTLLAAAPKQAAKETVSASPPAQPVQAGSKNTLPMGKIGDLKISRIILGGNLIGGWAHSRDLMYVSDLLKHYHTDEKVLQTLQLAEEHGVNCLNSHPDAGNLIRRYRKERGGKMLWMVQAYPDKDGDFGPCIRAAVEQGVDLIHIQGGMCDAYVEEGKVDVLDKGIRLIQAQGMPAGIGAHSMDVLTACEKAGVKADFYVKTLHQNNYFSAKRPDQGESIIRNPHDNFWCSDPDAVIKYMAKVDKPWMAFKVMAAGAIPPRVAFPYVFNAGADFVMAGMFDFQVAEDVRAAKVALEKVKRDRPWRG